MYMNNSGVAHVKTLISWMGTFFIAIRDYRELRAPT
jgi:hypothetical protein